MLQAQFSGAKILGLANAGGDFVNSVKAAREFGVTPGMNLAGLLVFSNDIHALGLDATQGMYLTSGWYWDMDDESRKWAARFEEKFKRKCPEPGGPGSAPPDQASVASASFFLPRPR